MNEQRKICFFNTATFWGGGEKWHFEASEQLSKTTHKAFFVCDGEGELAKRLENLNIEKHHVSANSLSFLNPSKINKLTQFFKTHKIDTIIFNNSRDLKLGGRAAKKAGVTTIVYRRGIAVEVKKSRLNEYFFSNIVTHFIFNSHATKALLQKNYQAVIATKKTAIIYNAIEFPQKILLPSSTSIPQIIIGNAGRLVAQKAQHFLIDIARKLKQENLNFKILIAGDGELYQDLKQKISHQNLTNHIELLGFVEDMSLFMNQIDVFVSTALWEGFGFVLAEAMVAKKPVLAFDVSSNPELIEEGKNGHLIPLKDIDCFASKIAKLIKDEALRKKMGVAAYNFAKTNFEKEQQFQKLLDFI